MKQAWLPAGLGFALAAALSVVACGDDEPTPLKALPPPVLSIVSAQAVGGPVWTPGADTCVELGQDADQTVLMTVDTTNSDGVGTFTLRPPGTCGSARQCGTVVLRVDPSGESEALRVQAAQTTLAAKLATLGAGSHTFRVELRDKNDEPIVDAEAGATLFAEITLDLKAAGGCGGTTDSGADADSGPSDAASDADAGGADASDAGDAADVGDTGADSSGDAPADSDGEAAADAGDGAASD